MDMKTNIKIKRLDYTEAKGPAWARWMASLMHDNEDFFLQVDSHTRFTPGWDESLIRQIEHTPSYPNSVLSHYPIEYNPLKDELSEARLKDMPVLCNMEWNNDGVPELRASSHTMKEHDGPTLTPFVSANFFFAHAQFLDPNHPDAVLFDPHLPYVFMGEEPLLGLRFWTHGYDIWTPYENTCFHYYTRSDGPKFWEYIPEYNEKSDIHIERVKYILQLPERKIPTPPAQLLELDKYGTGTNRSVEDYYQLMGVDRVAKKVNPKWCNSPSPKTYEEVKERGFGLPF